MLSLKIFRAGAGAGTQRVALPSSVLSRIVNFNQIMDKLGFWICVKYWILDIFGAGDGVGTQRVALPSSVLSRIVKFNQIMDKSGFWICVKYWILDIFGAGDGAGTQGVPLPSSDVRSSVVTISKYQDRSSSIGQGCPELVFTKPKPICFCFKPIRIQNLRFYPIRA